MLIGRNYVSYTWINLRINDYFKQLRKILKNRNWAVIKDAMFVSRFGNRNTDDLNIILNMVHKGFTKKKVHYQDQKLACFLAVYPTAEHQFQ